MSTKSGHKDRGQKPIRTFAEYQAMVERTDERKKIIVSLLGLAGELGDLNSTFKKLVLQRDSRTLRGDLREDIGDILWYLTSLAVLHKIPLQEAARESARKADRLYSQGEVNHFDDGFDDEERLPRQFSVTFSEKRNGKQLLVRIMVSPHAPLELGLRTVGREAGRSHPDPFARLEHQPSDHASAHMDHRHFVADVFDVAYARVALAWRRHIRCPDC